MSMQLTTQSQMIDPFWFNKVKSGWHFSKVEEDRSILLEGKKLLFSNHNEALEPGTEVRVWLVRYFECEPIADYKERLAKMAEQEKAEKERWRILANKRRDEAIALNSTINIGVKWAPGVKDVISGLLENSNGDGRNKATVQHIYLEEAYQKGRLKRKAGDFLCTSSSGSNGKNYCDQTHVHFTDGDGNKYNALVTCKKCLQLAGVQKK